MLFLNTTHVKHEQVFNFSFVQTLCSLSYHSGVLVGKSDLEIQENDIFS